MIVGGGKGGGGGGGEGGGELTTEGGKHWQRGKVRASKRYVSTEERRGGE